MKPSPYIVRIYAGPHDQYLGVASDEDAAGDLPRTSDPQSAARFDKFSDARREAIRSAKSHPGHQFKVFTLDAARQGQGGE